MTQKKLSIDWSKRLESEEIGLVLADGVSTANYQIRTPEAIITYFSLGVEGSTDMDLTLRTGLKGLKPGR